MEVTSAQTWSESKSALVLALGVPEPLLHVIIGLAGFLLVAIALRGRPRGLACAWSAVLLAQFVNEMLDARDWIRWTGTVNWSEAASDTVLTLALPSALILAFGLASVTRRRS